MKQRIKIDFWRISQFFITEIASSTKDKLTKNNNNNKTKETKRKKKASAGYEVSFKFALLEAYLQINK